MKLHGTWYGFDVWPVLKDPHLIPADWPEEVRAIMKQAGVPIQFSPLKVMYATADAKVIVCQSLDDNLALWKNAVVLYK